MLHQVAKKPTINGYLVGTIGSQQVQDTSKSIK